MIEASGTDVKPRCDIAIIGMAAMFPDCEDLSSYWSLLRDGKDAIRPIPLTHFDLKQHYSADPRTPDMIYGKAGGFLKPYPFDPLAFGLSPAQIEATDTSQILGMVTAHLALEDAGYGQKRSDFDRQQVSCIMGVTGALKLMIPLGARLHHPRWRQVLEQHGIASEEADAIIQDVQKGYVGWQEASFPGLLGNVVAGRIASRLNLGGTNQVSDAACASSLAAIHTAVMELSMGHCEMAVTGGVDTFSDTFMYACFSKTPALSPSGHARAYDAEGDGTTLGEGVGVFVLKRYADALRDGDRVYARIRGVGSSSDGRGKAIYTPKAAGQAQALRRAYQQAGLSPASVGLLEGHGTGTKVGDGVELEALTEVFRAAGAAPASIPLGSVKSQIGHTKAAAGAAGLMKAALALHLKVVPGSRKVKTHHPLFQNSPFFLNHHSRPWFSREGVSRRAGVSAFGFGGSNYHCVLEEAVPNGSQAEVRQWEDKVILVRQGDLDQVLAWWQKGDVILQALEGGFGGLQRLQRQLIQQVCSATTGQWRLAIYGQRSDSSEPWHLLVNELNGRFQQPHSLSSRAMSWAGSGLGFSLQRVTQPPPQQAWLFSSQGSQYPQMGLDYALRHPVARRVWEESDLRLRSLVFGDLQGPKTCQDWQQSLRATAVAQPAIGGCSLAIARTLESFGLRPDACGGHSFGELTALCIAGTISQSDFLKLAAERGRVMQQAAQRSGSSGMLALAGSAQEVQQILSSHPCGVVIANDNAPNQVIVAGSAAALEQATRIFAHLKPKRLAVAAAFHSKAVSAAEQPWLQALNGVQWSPTQLPVYSNTTAELYPSQPEQQRLLLSKQLAQPVRFKQMIEGMYADGIRCFIEVGPRGVLARLVAKILGHRDDIHVLTSDEEGRPWSLPRLLAQLWSLGYNVDLSSWLESSCIGDSVYTDPQRFTIPISGPNHRSGEGHASPAQAKARQPQKTTLTKPESGKRKTMENQGQDYQDLQQQLAELRGQVASLHTMLAHTQRQLQEVMAQRMQAQPQPMPHAFGWSQPYLPPMPAPNQQPMMPAPLPQPPVLGAMSQAPVAEAPMPAAPVAAAPIPAAPQTPAVSTQLGADTAAKSPVPQPSPSAASVAPSALEHDQGSFAVILREIIAEKTGFPKEAISLQQDLESDLGVDSIKKVEIMSALSEKVPAAAGLSQEQLSTMQTLEDIISGLQAMESRSTPSTSSPMVTAAASSQVIPQAPVPGAEAPGAVAQEAVQAMKEVIAEKTGFPAEQLGTDMHFEDSLGIDSIKRVEIMAAFQERFPALGQLPQDQLAAANTIGEVADCLKKPQASVGVAHRSINENHSLSLH